MYPITVPCTLLYLTGTLSAMMASDLSFGSRCMTSTRDIITHLQLALLASTNWYSRLMPPSRIPYTYLAQLTAMHVPVTRRGSPPLGAIGALQGAAVRHCTWGHLVVARTRPATRVQE